MTVPTSIDGGAEPQLTIVIPAYNEEESLPALLPRLLRFAHARNLRVVVVDDGSKDRTGEILAAHRDPALHVVTHKVNRGYGGALKSGIRAVSTPLAITIDADGQHRFEDVVRLHRHLLATDADMVVGSRTGKAANASAYRALGKFLIRRIARFLMPVPVHDINSGMKIYRADLAKAYLPLCPDSMAFSDVMTLVFVSQRHRVLEHPIRILARAGGTSTISTRTAFQTVLEILNIVLLFNPARVFLPISAAMACGGVALGLPIALAGRGVSVGSMLAIVAGLVFFFMGLVAEQLSMLRKSRIGRD